MKNAIRQSCVLLTILPALSFVLQSASVAERHPFYASWSDPTYYYFFTGLHIAEGDWQVDDVQHPGTPLQLYAAAMFRILFLFRPGDSLAADALADPEWYLLRFCLVQCLLMSLALWWAGAAVRHISGSLPVALMMQLTPLISVRCLFYSNNLMTEFILVLCGILITPWLLSSALPERGKFKGNTMPALLSGVLMAGKIIAFPIALAWLAILRGGWNKARFVLLWAIAFLLATFPAWGAAGKFMAWMTGMATHTGKYGSGEAGLIDSGKILENLSAIFGDCLPFTVSFVALPLLALAGVAGNNPLRGAWPVQSLRIVMALWLAMTLQVLMVTKHYTAHYMIPAYMLAVPAWAVLAATFSSRKPWNIPAKLQSMLILFAGLLLLGYAAKAYHFFPGMRQPARDVRAWADQQNYDLRLYDCHITAPWPEPGIYFGVNYSGEQTGRYLGLLSSLYPGFYEVENERSSLRQWKTEKTPDETLQDTLRVLYYVSDPAFDVNSLHLGDWTPGPVHASYRHPVSGESAHILSFHRR